MLNIAYTVHRNESLSSFIHNAGRIATVPINFDENEEAHKYVQKQTRSIEIMYSKADPPPVSSQGNTDCCQLTRVHFNYSPLVRMSIGICRYVEETI